MSTKLEMGIRSRNCPDNPEEMAEAYALGQLSSGDREAFSTHATTCRVCRLEIEQAVRVALAFATAARLLRSHDSAHIGLGTGPVFLYSAVSFRQRCLKRVRQISGR